MPSYQLFAQGWKLEKDRDGIQVFTRNNASSPIKEYKAIVTIETTIDKLVRLMKNHANLKNWFVKCPESVQLAKISEEAYYVYFLNDAPWPVSDRDNITLMEFEKLTNGTHLVHLKSVPDYIPEKLGIVRIEKMKALWTFEPQTNGLVKITQQVSADLGGNIPPWLINFAIVDAPFNTLSNLKKELKK